MLSVRATWALLLLVGVARGEVIERSACNYNGTGDFYSFTAKPLNGTMLATINFSDFVDEVVLITPVASYNDRTTAKYFQLNELVAAFSTGFRVLGFPCLQFNKEEPGATATEIYNAIKYVRPGNGFEANFQLTTKIDVNGPDADPIFTYLKTSCDYTEDLFRTDVLYEPYLYSDVRDTFEYFLVDKSGKVAFRYHPSMMDTATIIADITALISA